MSDEDNEPEFALLMPFVVCQSSGGVYEDEAFVAGVRYGTWDSMLKMGPSQHSNYEPKDLVRQLDLLAMHMGYTMTVEPWDVSPDWVLVTMRR